MSNLAEHLRDLIERVDRGEIKVTKVRTHHEYRDVDAGDGWQDSEYTGRSSYTFHTEVLEEEAAEVKVYE